MSKHEPQDRREDPLSMRVNITALKDASMEKVIADLTKLVKPFGSMGIKLSATKESANLFVHFPSKEKCDQAIAALQKKEVELDGKKITLDVEHAFVRTEPKSAETKTGDTHENTSKKPEEAKQPEKKQEDPKPAEAKTEKPTHTDKKHNEGSIQGPSAVPKVPVGVKIFRFEQDKNGIFSVNIQGSPNEEYIISASAAISLYEPDGDVNVLEDDDGLPPYCWKLRLPQSGFHQLPLQIVDPSIFRVSLRFDFPKRGYTESVPLVRKNTLTTKDLRNTKQTEPQMPVTPAQPAQPASEAPTLPAIAAAPAKVSFWKRWWRALKNIPQRLRNFFKRRPTSVLAHIATKAKRRRRIAWKKYGAFAKQVAAWLCLREAVVLSVFLTVVSGFFVGLVLFFHTL